MARKSEVYSWRLSPVLKARLEEAARRGRRTVAQLLEEITTDHLVSDEGSGAEGQRRLHQRAQRFAGCMSGKDPGRAAHARRLVRARLRRTRGAR